ncbi:hypothetical protein [Cellulomonas pakistanensis]|uniref:Uncharacterized protein n=1 Tax=Cellulomonas pakistanensis TaxID=992287 RepID=A0A919P996_9CELL|nr:hypothetical protein [Cellulomonas pakistanensis]GIG34774.1 hypothetical protein Cpa01nite_01550 [Cellulomonas pakistanensis]
MAPDTARGDDPVRPADDAVRPADELVAAVTERFAGSAYVVERTPDGFVVHADLTHQHVHRPRRDRRTRTLVRHHVVLDERRFVMTVTDEQVDVTWRAGATPGSEVPVLGAGIRVEHRRGRVREVSFSATWDPRRPRGERLVDARRFDSGEALQHIRTAAGDLGWHERRGTAERVGRAFALVAAVGAGVTLVGLVVALLLGRF